MSRLMDATRWPIIDWKDLQDLEKEEDAKDDVNNLELKSRLTDNNKRDVNVMRKIIKVSAKDVSAKDVDQKIPTAKELKRKRVSFQDEDSDVSKYQTIQFHGKDHLNSGTYFKDWISATHKLSGSRISIKIVPKDNHVNNNNIHKLLNSSFGSFSAKDGQEEEWKKIMNERKIWQKLSKLNHVVPLISFINSKNNYYFITPTINNLISLDMIMFNHEPLPLKAAMIIGGQLVAIIDTIHSSFGIILRNLSSGSILIDSTFGIVKLINFNNSKEINSSKRCIYETIYDDYKSPEMLKCKSYTNTTDWWSFGIILLQLLSGSTPLAIYKEKTSISSDMDSLDVLIRATDLIPEMIAKVPEVARNLLQNLLQTNPRKRLGFDSNDFKIMQKDVFFKGLSWKKLGSRS